MVPTIETALGLAPLVQSSYKRCVGCLLRVLGVGWGEKKGERDLVVSIGHGNNY